MTITLLQPSCSSKNPVLRGFYLSIVITLVKNRRQRFLCGETSTAFETRRPRAIVVLFFFRLPKLIDNIQTPFDFQRVHNHLNPLLSSLPPTSRRRHHWLRRPHSTPHPDLYRLMIVRRIQQYVQQHIRWYFPSVYTWFVMGFPCFYDFPLPRGASDPSPKGRHSAPPARRLGHRRSFFRCGLNRLLCGAGVEPRQGRGRRGGAREY